MTTQLACVMLLVLAVLVPGLVLVRLLRLPTLDGWGTVPMAVAAGIASATIPSTLSVTAGTGMRGFVLAFAAWTALVLAVGVVVLRRRGEVRRLVRVRALGLPALGCMLLSLVSAAAAAVAGTTFRSDSAVHASIVEKLANLPGARFDELGLVADGRPIDSAILPVWHHLLALAALPFAHPGIVALWSAGAAVALAVPWAGAALGYAATRSRGGALLAAALVTGAWLVPWDGMPPGIRFLAYPGNVTILIVLPLLFALLAVTLAEPQRERGAHLRALGLLTAVVALLHLTYLYHVVLAALGMALVLVVLRPSAWRALVAPAVVVASVSGAALAASLLVLRHSEQFNRGASDGWQRRVDAQWSGILDGAGSALDPRYFLAAGGVAVAGMLLSVLVLPLVRGRDLAGAMLAVGPLLVLGAAARSDLVAGAVAGLGSFPPIPRTYRLLPWIVAIVVVMHALDRSDWLRRRAVGIGGGVALAAAAVALWLTSPGLLHGRDLPAGELADVAVPGWLFDAVLVVLALELAVLAVRRSWRQWADEMPPAPAGALTWAMGAALLLAAAGFGLAGASEGLADRPPRLLHADGLFGTRVANDATADLLTQTAARTPGARVFTEEGAAMRMAATAPVYVTHVRKLAFSSAERLHDYQVVIGEHASDETRLAYLSEHEIDLVLLPLPDTIRRDMVRLLGSDPGWEQVQRGDDLVGWRRRTGLTVRPVAQVERPARAAVRDRAFRTRDGVRLALDVDYPATLPAGGAPAVLLLHGGGWWSGNRGQLSEAGGLAHELAAAGFVAVSADYGLACSTPQQRRALWGDEFDTENHACGAVMRDQVADVQALVAWVHTHARELGIDPARVALLGISAGGQLALRAAFDAAPDAPIAAVAHWSGPPASDFIARQPRRPVPPVKSLRAPFANAVGCDVDACPGEWAFASPFEQLDEADARVAVLSIGGEQELQVPFAQLERLHARLEELGAEHELHAGIEDCHGTSCGMRRLAGSGRAGIDVTIEFLQRQLGVRGAGSAER